MFTAASSIIPPAPIQGEGGNEPWIAAAQQRVSDVVRYYGAVYGVIGSGFPWTPTSRISAITFTDTNLSSKVIVDPHLHD